MASVYLTSSNSVANDTRTDNFSQLRRSALTGRAPNHHLVATPEEADIILFSNSLFVNQADIRSHFLTKKFADKIFVYSTTDRQVPFFPGVYTCAERRWYIPSHMRSGFYIKVLDHDWIRPSPINEESPYLFSFAVPSIRIHSGREWLRLTIPGDLSETPRTTRDVHSEKVLTRISGGTPNTFEF